nr:hypothetical protein [uncultured Carboxylicivirga sp.]
MKKTTLVLFALFFLCFGCNNDDDSTGGGNENEEETSTIPEYFKTIDFSHYVDDNYQINDFDVEDGYLYFDYNNIIYRNDLSTEISVLETIFENEEDDWLGTLKVIGNSVYYQGVIVWEADYIKEIYLDAISEGVQNTYSINGIHRGQLGKNGDKLYYLSSISSISPINNFYEFKATDTDPLIATDEYIHPKNMRTVDNYLYFSSQKEIRQFDLDDSKKTSSVVYTASETDDDNYIEGFDILNNVIYYTLSDNNNIYYINIDSLEEEPNTFIPEDEEDSTCRYRKLIISDGKLYVKKVNEKEIEVWNLNESKE